MCFGKIIKNGAKWKKFYQKIIFGLLGNLAKNLYYTHLSFLEHSAGPNLVRGSNPTSNKIYANNFANEAS